MLESHRTLRNGNSEKLPENVKLLDLPDARYRIVYERHDINHSPEGIGKPDAIASELIVPFDYSTPEGAQKAIDRRWQRYKKRQSHDPLRRPMETHSEFEVHLQSNHIPFYFVDISVPRDKFTESLEEKLILLSAGEMGAGAAASGYVAAKIVRGLSRRDFLKITGAGALAIKGGLQAASWNVGSEEKKHTQLSPVEKKIMGLHELINPETAAFFLSFSNAIWAHKLHFIATSLQLQTPGKPEVAFQTGYAHSGIEDMLKADASERLAYIKRAATALNMLVPVGEGGMRISPLARFEFSDEKKRWAPTLVTRIPELENIENSLNTNGRT